MASENLNDELVPERTKNFLEEIIEEDIKSESMVEES
jgi:hypothetical protein